jgi:tripartite-type tricarboxylate transporter receptor subunit TctC
MLGQRVGRKAMVIRASLGLVLCLWLSAPAAAQSVEQFYRGRELRLMIGEPPGGGYDLYGRFLARHLSRFLPGNPSILPENMPGAASVTMTNALFFQMPKDGSVIGSGAGSVGTAALFGSPGARYDARRLGWIGSLNSEVGMVVAWHLAAVKTAADLFVKPLIVGGSGATDGNVIFPNTMNNVLGTRMKVIPGYGSTASIATAMEQGEVDGMGSWHYSSILAGKPQWLAERKIVLLVQLSLSRHPDQPDVPTVLELARDDAERALIELVFAQQQMGRPVFAPPEIPAERLAALRQAFDAMMHDPQVLADAESHHIEINQPMPGAEIERLIQRLHGFPAALVARSAQAIRPAAAP